MDHAGHQPRLLQEYAASKHASSAVIFFDFEAAHYSVSRSLVVNGTATDEELAKKRVLQTCGITGGQLHQFAAILADGTCLERLHCHSHLQALVAEFYSTNWWRIEGSDAITCVGKGSRPDDPFADLFFGFVMFQRLLLAYDQLDSAGLTDFIQWNDAHTIEAEGDSQALAIRGPCWADDIALLKIGAADSIVDKIAATADIFINSFTPVGLKVKLGPAKSAVVARFAGPGSKLAKHRAIISRDRRIPLHTAQGYTPDIELVPSYRHMGGWI